MTEQEIKEKILKEQDIIAAGIDGIFRWEKVFSTDPKMSYTDAEKMIFNDEELLNKIDMNNLLKLITTISKQDKEKFEKVRDITIKRLETEEFFVEDIDVSPMLVTFHKSDQVASILGKEVTDKLTDKAVEQIKEFKGTEWWTVASKFKRFQDVANFSKYYKEGIFTEEKRQALEKMLERNENTLDYFNFGLFKDEIYNELPSEFVEYVSNFPTLSQRLIATQKNNPKLHSIFVERVNNYDNLIDNYDEIKDMIEGFSDYCFELTPEKLENATYDNILEWLNIREKHNMDVMGKEKDLPLEYTDNYLDKVRDFYADKYQEYLNEELKIRKKAEENAAKREEINRLLEAETDPKKKMDYEISLITMSSPEALEKQIKKAEESKIDFYFKRKFLMSAKEARELLKEYGDDLDNLPGIESEKSFFTELKATLDNTEHIDQMFKEDEKLYTSLEIDGIKKSVARECAKSYASNLKDVEDKVNGIIEDKNPEFYDSVEIDGEKVNIVKLTDKFDMFVHSTDSGFIVEKKLDEEHDFKKSWNNAKVKSDHILSTAYINQDFMGMPPLNNNGVMYGFASLPAENIRLMGVTDINTYSRAFAFNSSTKQYMSAKTMPYSSRRVYSEFALEKKNPDYVIFFDDSSDEVRANTYKAAKQFGIPAVYIDKKEIVKKQIGDLDTLVQDFEKTGDTQTLKTLINKYETNVAGWLLNRTDAEDESHTKGIDNSRFKEDFDAVGAKIEGIVTNYLDTIQTSKEDKSNELVDIATILLKEKQLYEDSKSGGPEKKISPTQFSLDAETITKKLNETFEQKGMGEYVITDETTLDEYLKMRDITRNAICKERVTMSDVKDSKQVEEKNKDVEAPGVW